MFSVRVVTVHINSRYLSPYTTPTPTRSLRGGFKRRSYGARAAYAQSKLAELLFVRELERRMGVKEGGGGVVAGTTTTTEDDALSPPGGGNSGRRMSVEDDAVRSM